MDLNSQSVMKPQRWLTAYRRSKTQPRESANYCALSRRLSVCT
jgi:hypothetical protein